MANMNMENYFRYQDPKAVLHGHVDMIEMPTYEVPKDKFKLPKHKINK